MIVVNLKGGLGNQMFQYAFGLALADRSATSLKFDLRTLRDRTPRPGVVFRDFDLDVFGVRPEQASARDLRGVGLGVPYLRAARLVSKLHGLIPRQSRILRERRLTVYDPAVLRAGGHVYVDGYWQNEKYFQPVAPLIRRRFVTIADLSPSQKALRDRIVRGKSVCVNVRRGDFVNHPLHPACDRSYYDRALAAMRRKIGEDFAVFVFSDDVAWCRENLNLWKEQTVVGHEYAGRKFAAYLSLMSACRHFIIPNSSFAWWAAWLSGGEDKVIIGPERWFADSSIDTSDVLPKEWIRA